MGWLSVFRPEVEVRAIGSFALRRLGELRLRPAAYGCLVSLEWEQVIVDARDPAALGRWWANALGWVVVNDSAEEFEIRPSADRLPGLVFVPVPEVKPAKNRLHLDFRPDDQQAEVERFVRAGARHVDIGQGKRTWVVLADPEGIEFCVLAARRA